MLEQHRDAARRYFKKGKADIAAEQQQQIEDADAQMQGLVRLAESASSDIRATESELAEFLRSNEDVARQFLLQSR